MSGDRADLGFGAALGDLTAFTPKPKTAPKENTAKVAEDSGFHSREPKNKTSPKLQRRRRTGRNAQLNIKAKPETIEAFYNIADVNGWGLGETLEHAVEMLTKK